MFCLVALPGYFSDLEKVFKAEWRCMAVHRYTVLRAKGVAAVAMPDAKTSTLLIAGVAHGLIHLLMLALPYITVKLLEVAAVKPEQQGWVVLLLNTPAYFIFGFGALPAGVLADRYGPTRTIAMGLLLTVVSGIGLFLLWPLGLPVIAAFFTLYSLGAGLYHPAGLAWVSKTFVEDRGKALGRHGIGGSIGQASSPLVSALILSTPFWPLIFIFLAGAALAVAIVCFSVHIEKWEMEETKLEETTKGGFLGAMTVLVFFLVTMLFVTRGMFYRGTVTALPVYLNKELGALLLLAGLYGTIIYIAGAVGQEVGGRLTDRFGWKRTLIGVSLLSAISLVVLALPYTPNLASDALLLVSIILFGFSFFATQASANTMVAQLSTTTHRGIVFGYSFFMRFGMGALGIPLVSLSQLLFGTWTLGFLILAILPLVTVVIAPFIEPRRGGK